MKCLTPLFLVATVGIAGCERSETTAPPASPGEGGSFTYSASEGAPETGARIVTFPASGRNFAAFESDVRRTGGHVVFSFPEIGVAVVRGLPDSRLVALARARGAQSAGPDLVLSPPRPERMLSAGQTSDPEADPSTEPFFELQWNIRMIDADRAIEAGYTGKGAKIAIIDTGIYYLHPDLAPNYLGGRNFFAPFCEFDPESLPSTCDPNDPIDDNGHGSHVAGIVAAAHNRIGVIGVAPDAKLIAAKVCGRSVGCPTSSIIAGILYAAQEGVDAMNLSLGGYLFVNQPADRADFVALMRATNYAHRQGSLVVNSAGNLGLDLQRLPGFIKRTTGEANNMLVVSAVGPDGEPAHIEGEIYTNYGNIVDVAAPGGSFPPVTALVLSTWSPLSLDLPALYVFSAGTSMAAPHVAGTAAQIVGKYGPLNPSQIRTRIQQSAVDMGKSGRDPFFGHGLVNVWNALQSRSR